MSKRIQLVLRSFLGIAVVLLITGIPSSFAQATSIEEWATERDTNFYALSEEWRLTQPVTLTIRFALKNGPGSQTSTYFLDALDQNIGTLTYGTNFRVHPVVVPAKYHYAMSIDFANLAAWRRHETSPELLKFVGTHWRDNVVASEETVVITPPK